MRYSATILLLPLAALLTSGCTASVNVSNRGGGGDDASSCIDVELIGDEPQQSEVTNGCNRDVNMLEFSTGSRGLFVVPANSTITREETIAAWGACLVPSVPERTGDFDFFCD